LNPTDIVINKSAAIPTYYQIMRQLQDMIQRGTLVADEAIPSERDFCKALNISRNTIRQAIGKLVSDGLLYKKKGIGIFVSQQKAKMNQPLSSLPSFTEYVRSQGMTPVSKVIELGLVTPPLEVSKALDCEAYENVIALHRLRLADGLPMAIEKSYLDSVLCQNILYADFNHDSLYETLRNKCGLQLSHCHESIELGFCDVEAGQHLEIPPGTPVFHRTRTTYTKTGAIEYVVSQCRVDRFKFYLEVSL